MASPPEHLGTYPRTAWPAFFVHRPSDSGGRRVTVHSGGREDILGIAYSDHVLVVFLEGAGVAEPEAVLDDPRWVEWRGGPAHEFHPA
ncbi:hypothetical protein [Streptomyces huasconensis]|uniref:hypothetical protein n=1 Tax=Streptomyces huasconensis TaxID=1854574 RepID=UPI0033F95E27